MMDNKPMMTPTQEIMSQYNVTETVTDKFGRVIVVRTLRQSLIMRVVDMVGSKEGFVVARALVAASIKSIDGTQYAIPVRLPDIMIIADALGRHGYNAATPAYIKLNGEEEEIEDNQVEETDAD